jgi:hypothetical protein
VSGGEEIDFTGASPRAGCRIRIAIMRGEHLARAGFEVVLTGAAKPWSFASPRGAQTPLLGKRVLPSSAKLLSSVRCAFRGRRFRKQSAAFDTPFLPRRRAEWVPTGVDLLAI